MDCRINSFVKAEGDSRISKRWLRARIVFCGSSSWYDHPSHTRKAWQFGELGCVQLNNCKDLGSVIADRFKDSNLSMVIVTPILHTSSETDRTQTILELPQVASRHHFVLRNTMSVVSLKGAVSNRIFPGQLERMKPKSMWTRTPCLSISIYSRLFALSYIPIIPILDLKNVANYWICSKWVNEVATKLSKSIRFFLKHLCKVILLRKNQQNYS